MKTNLDAIKLAYKRVIEKHNYKQKKRIVDAIFWELFFDGFSDISEIAISAYIDSLDIKANKRVISKSNKAAAQIGCTNFCVCMTEDNSLYIVHKSDYQKDFENHIFTVKGCLFEITEDKDKMFTLLNCMDLFADIIDYNSHKAYFSGFFEKQIIKALSIYIYLKEL